MPPIPILIFVALLIIRVAPLSPTFASWLSHLLPLSLVRLDLGYLLLDDRVPHRLDELLHYGSHGHEAALNPIEEPEHALEIGRLVVHEEDLAARALLLE